MSTEHATPGFLVWRLSMKWRAAVDRAVADLGLTHAQYSVLASLLESMSGPTTRARVWRGLTQTGARARTLAEHRAILDALAAHDPEVARSWATVHIAGVEQWLASMP